APRNMANMGLLLLRFSGNFEIYEHPVRGQQLEVEGDGNKNVPLYYYITDNIRIQLRREEFCLVNGLRFEVENLADYDDVESRIPFRRRVFPSYLDGEPITGNMVLKIIDDELFDRLHDDDAVSLCCLGILQLVLLGVEGKRMIPDWLLRLAIDRGNLLVERLTPDETGARSDWVVPHHSRHIQTAAPSSISAQPGPSNWQSQMLAQSAIPYWQPAFSSHPGNYNWQSPIPSHMGNPNLQRSIQRHHDAAGLFNQNILNRGKREQRPSFYKRTPYTEQPPTTVLPKQRGNKNKNNVKKANLSPLNLGNAFDDENEGGDDVIFLGGHFTGNYLVYENVNPEKVKRENYVNYTEFLNDPEQIYLDCYMKGYSVPVTFWQQLVPHLCMPDIDSRTPMGWLSGEHMNAWMELLIRFRRSNDPWTVAYTNTISVHPENQRFLIEMDQHTIGTLDGSTRPYPAWSVVNWVLISLLICIKTINTIYV
ncbi:hypothetical protein Tco_1279307, partial [Tanacetum coccineum]